MHSSTSKPSKYRNQARSKDRAETRAAVRMLHTAAQTQDQGAEQTADTADRPWGEVLGARRTDLLEALYDSSLAVSWYISPDQASAGEERTAHSLIFPMYIEGKSLFVRL